MGRERGGGGGRRGRETKEVVMVLRMLAVVVVVMVVVADRPYITRQVTTIYTTMQANKHLRVARNDCK